MPKDLTSIERQEGMQSITARFGAHVPPDVQSQCELFVREENYEQQLQILQALHDLLQNESSSLTKAKEIIERGGGKFYGPESLLAMRLKVPNVIPPLPPTEEIERYAKQGFSLRLMPDKAADNSPLTMAKMNEVFDPLIKQCQNKQPGEEDWKLLYKVDWYATEDLYTKDATVLCWAFTSDKLLDGSTGINYLEQTDCIATYVCETLYKGTALPQEVESSLGQFQSKRSGIETDITANRWKQAADELAKLEITQLFRPEAQEVLFYFAQTFLNSPPNKRERLLEALYAWTKTQSSSGSLVSAGLCDPGGARVSGVPPDYSPDFLGALVVRKFRTLQP